MIAITCSNCKATLEIDDAFAGGVCRCQHCGTIQTVPARSARPASAPAPTVLHQARGRRTSDSGLDQLADAVASSGLTRRGLTQKTMIAGAASTAPPAAPTAEPESAPDRRLLSILLIGGAILIILIAVLVVVLLNRGGNTPSAGTGPTVNSNQDSLQGPSFCGVPLVGERIIFVLDRGNSIAELFDTLKAVTYRSLGQLGPTRQFQIIFWDNTETGSSEFPQGGLHSATLGEVDQARQAFQDLAASGRTHVSGPFKEAMERHPSQIVIATQKADLDEDDANALRSWAGKDVRIDVVQLGSDSPNPILQEAAKAGTGQFRLVSAPELRGFAQ